MENSTSSKSCEWYTPKPIITLIKNIIGPITLDPASCDKANEIVGAERIFTKEDDGLSMPWFADTVFLNPPFGKYKNKSIAGIWLDYMKEQFRLRRFSHGICLTHTRPGYGWWEKHWRERTTCMTLDKIDFIPGDEREQDTSGSKTSQTLFLFTDSRSMNEKFRSVLSFHGRVLGPEI